MLGTNTPTIGAGFGSSSMASFFTRWTYSYDNRYNATYTYRYDGSQTSAQTIVGQDFTLSLCLGALLMRSS